MIPPVLGLRKYQALNQEIISDIELKVVESSELYNKQAQV